MPSVGCTICTLDAKPRKQAEAMLKAGVGLREVAEFMTWQGEQDGSKIKISKSALDRHRANGHFVSEETVDISQVTDEEVKSLRDYARDLFKAYQKANKGKVPSTKELIDFLLADAKLADIESRRKDEESLRVLMSGASFKRPTEEADGGPEGQSGNLSPTE